MNRAEHPVHLVAGLVVWMLWFVVLYGLLSVGCAVAPPGPGQGIWNWINASLWLISLVVVVGLALAGWWCWRAAIVSDESHARFMTRVSAAIYGLSAAATLAVALPVLFYPPCV